jgi:hypothetical protein
MRFSRLALACVLAGAVASGATAQTQTDFSGTWQFDRAKSMQPGPDGSVVLAALLGDEFTARQDATGLSLSIKSGAIRASAFFKLDGSESRNTSPGGAGQPDVEVVSTAAWRGGKLVITSKSTSGVQGKPTLIVTTRVMWIDKDGSLMLDRSGTPVSEITPTRSVYTRVKQ